MIMTTQKLQKIRDMLILHRLGLEKECLREILATRGWKGFLFGLLVKLPKSETRNKLLGYLIPQVQTRSVYYKLCKYNEFYKIQS